MTTQPTTRVTDTTVQFWADAGETYNALQEAMEELTCGDHRLSRIVHDHQEQPTVAEVSAHMHRALDMIGAAQKHYYDVRRLHRHLVREADEMGQEAA